MNLNEFSATPLPIDPSIISTGIEAEKCNVFKSALSPLKLTFKVPDEHDNPRIKNGLYSVMYKINDDLRQD